MGQGKYAERFKKESIDLHINILNEIYGEHVYIEKVNETKDKNRDLILTLGSKEYIVECKSDWARCDDTIVVELVANIRRVLIGKFSSGTYPTNDIVRKRTKTTKKEYQTLHEFIEKLLQTEKYRSTAFFNFEEEKTYLFSYRAEQEIKEEGFKGKSYYLLDLKVLSAYVRKTWKEHIILINTEDSCSIMVKLPYSAFKEFLFHEKKIKTYRNIANL